MKISYEVAIDIRPAVDQYGYLDDHAASRIASESGAYPDGATIRLNIGHARGGVPSQLAQELARAGEVILSGSNPRGMRVVAEILNGVDPFALAV